jgi:16S rRNA (uracil1498-N3)-methyltransferase
MSRTPWIYCAPLADCSEVELSPEESRHLVGSHRRRLGESLILFDGVGSIAHAKLRDIKKRPLSGQAEIISKEFHPKPTRRTRLASALPKGDRQGLMLELVTQLGITDFIPLLCARSISRPGKSGYARWERILIEACKQCERAWLPDIHSESTPSDILSNKLLNDEVVLLADKQGKSGKNISLDDRASDQLLLVGPEGGFTIEERKDILKRGALPVCLSENNLRIETAAAAIVSLVRR